MAAARVPSPTLRHGTASAAGSVTVLVTQAVRPGAVTVHRMIHHGLLRRVQVVCSMRTAAADGRGSRRNESAGESDSLSQSLYVTQAGNSDSDTCICV
jgi:hypothetical protein